MPIRPKASIKTSEEVDNNKNSMVITDRVDLEKAVGADMAVADKEAIRITVTATIIIAIRVDAAVTDRVEGAVTGIKTTGTTTRIIAIAIIISLAILRR